MFLFGGRIAETRGVYSLEYCEGCVEKLTPESVF